LDFSGSTNGFLTTYAYDAMDNVTSVVQGGLNPRSYVYDGLSQLTSETNPESGTTVYSYDSNGNLASRTRPLPNQWDPATTVTAYYGYDLLHRPTSVTYSNTTAHNVYTYDEAAPWGLSPSNGKGRLTSEFAYDNSGAFVAGMVFQYDSMGRVKNNSQCTPLYCGQTAFNVAYTYDLLGNMATLLNGAGITLTYAYNTAAQPVTLTSSLSDANHPGTLVSQLQYNALGLPIWATFGDNLNGHQSVTEAWNYNNRGQLQDQGGSMAIGTSPTRYWLSVPSGAYAPNGSMLSSNDSVNGGWTYAYDDFNRIVSSNKNSGQQTFSYDHDRFGNRWHQNAPQGGPAPQYTFDANNRISGFWFDPAGNLWNDGTYMYYYDAENRLVSLNSGPSYVYDAEGRRVRKTASGQTHDYIYDLAGRAIAEVDAVGSMTRGEIYLGSRHIATYSDSTYFSHLDGLGTERVRTGVTGSVVESFTSLAFGDALSGQGVSPLHFTGQERDSETGLDHFMFRHYSSTQGRWISPDPAGLAAVDPSNPQSWNRYAYVANQPTIMVDPYGLFIIRPVEDGGGGGAWSLSSGMLHMVVCFFGNCAPDPGPIGGGGDGGDDPGPPVLRRNPVPANNGRLPNGEVPLNPYAQAVFSHPTLQTAASTMTDPRTYALWTAAASVPGVIYNWGALSAAGSDLWMNVEAANPGATLKVIDVINVATPPWNIPTTSAGWTLFGYEVYDWYRNR
jgi:RHS repeat-associated protein